MSRHRPLHSVYERLTIQIGARPHDAPGRERDRISCNQPLLRLPRDDVIFAFSIERVIGCSSGFYPAEGRGDHEEVRKCIGGCRGTGKYRGAGELGRIHGEEVNRWRRALTRPASSPTAGASSGWPVRPASAMSRARRWVGFDAQARQAFRGDRCGSQEGRRQSRQHGDHDRVHQRSA